MNRIYNKGMTLQPRNDHDPTRPIRPRRPFLLSLLFWMHVFWAVLGWLRFAGALTERGLILERLTTGLHSYILLAGLISGLAALPALWGLLRSAPWTPRVITVTAVFYPAIYWFERLCLWADPSTQRNWPFMLLLTMIWLGLVFWALSSKKSQHYFGREDEDGM